MKLIFYFSTLLFVILSFSTSCSMFCKKGTGDVTIQNRKVAEFDEIDIDGQATIYLAQGDTTSVRVKIDSNLAEFITTEVSRNKLKIKEAKCIEEVTEFTIYITTPKLSKLDVGGSVKVLGENTIKSEKLYIKTKSSSEIKLVLDVEDLETNTKGSGLIKLMGRAINFDIKLGGAGSIDAFGLKAKEVDATVKGAGTCKINVSDEFYGDVKGSGKIYYKGNPKKVRTDASGSGTIQAK